MICMVYYVVTFFFLNAKNLGRSDDNKRRKEKSMASECVDSSRLQLSLSQAPTVNLMISVTEQ